VFEVTPSGNETVLYSFAGAPDGAYPGAGGGLVFDANGNLYGTTTAGGDNNNGTVFEVTPSGKETVLYSFCPDYPYCTDGYDPNGGLVFDKKGNLYGTTPYGGVGPGTVFKVTPSGKETVLHSFAGGRDGDFPYAGPVFDKKGNLYGTTGSGGANGKGIVFKVTPSGKETVLYSFCSRSGCTDGNGPPAGLVFDKKGNLYGTTEYGGDSSCGAPYGCGVVFEVTPSGKETVLYRFTGDSDGWNPLAGLVFDKKGSLYGTTYNGGTTNHGTVFKLTP